MIISIGADHWGIEMKNYIIMNLRTNGVVINNYGPNEDDGKKVDYVDYAISDKACVENMMKKSWREENGLGMNSKVNRLKMKVKSLKKIKK